MTSVPLLDLQDRLQSLWITHLHHLDQYATAQKELAALYSTGIFSLAQANFKNTSRTRYGPDHFDQRMQAATRFRVQQRPETDRSPADVPTTASGPLLLRSESDLDISRLGARPAAPETPAPAPIVAPGVHAKPESTPSVPEPTPPAPSAEKDAAPDRRRLDPIRWFGILVPQDLRGCQKAFLDLVTGPLLDASNAARAMRAVEVEIRRVRKEIRRAERAQTGGGG